MKEKRWRQCKAKLASYVFTVLLFSLIGNAQEKAIVNTSQSAYAKLSGVNMGDVVWTKGFWADRMKICRDSMVPHLWRTYTSKEISHAYANFQVAAGLDTGSHSGPSFHDGDFYKTLEAVASLYASTRDKKLDEMMDSVIGPLAFLKNFSEGHQLSFIVK